MSYLNKQTGYREELLLTRSVIKKENWVLLEPDGIVKNAIPGYENCDVTILATPAMGASFADYLVTAHAGGNNENQVKALADSVEEELYKAETVPKHIEGYDNANWILMDFGDIIVHVFNEDDRLFYDLERIWRDGKQVNINEL